LITFLVETVKVGGRNPTGRRSVVRRAKGNQGVGKSSQREQQELPLHGEHRGGEKGEWTA